MSRKHYYSFCGTSRWPLSLYIRRPYPDKEIFHVTFLKPLSLNLCFTSLQHLMTLRSKIHYILFRKKSVRAGIVQSMSIHMGSQTLNLRFLQQHVVAPAHSLTLIRHCHNVIYVPKSSSDTPTCRIGDGREQRRSVKTGAILLDDTASVMDALPVVGFGSIALGLGLVKVMAYSQLEVVRTAMLSRHVKQGNAKVLQLGGTTRDLYYYPTGTVKITVNDLGIKKGLFQQAGMTVGIPVEATSFEIMECLSKTPTGSLDSVVSFEQFGDIEGASELSTILSEIGRVLKPGGTFIFYQRLANGGFAQLGSRSSGSVLQIGEIISSSVDTVWDFCEYDVAAQGLDAHDVGVAVRCMAYEEDTFSVDDGAFEEILKKQKRQSSKARKKPASFSSSSSDGRSASKKSN